MKKSTVGYIFITLGIFIVLGYLGFAVLSFSQKDEDTICTGFDIYIVDNDELTLITPSEIANLLDRRKLDPTGKIYKNISTEDIETELSKNQTIKEVECYKTPAGKIRIDILQRTPKFIIAGYENLYVDSERKLFPLSANGAAYVPVVSGFVTTSFATGPIYDFVSYLENNSFWNAQIEQIHIQNDLNVELIPRVGNTVIMLGKLENYEIKLENLYKLYKQGFNVIGWNRYKKINLQYENQIVCTKANGVN